MTKYKTQAATNEVNAAAEEAKKLASKHVKKTKRAFDAMRKNNTTLFFTIRDAYNALFNEEHAASSTENAAFRHYRIDVESFCDKSSFNKIISICKNDLIMKNLDRLPVAWSTLSKLNVLLKTDDKSVAKTFIKLLDKNKITVTSTATSIVELLTPKTEPKKTSSSLTVVFYSDLINEMSEEQRTVFADACAALESLGFEMKDMCKKTANEEASNDASSDAKVSTESVREVA